MKRHYRFLVVASVLSVLVGFAAAEGAAAQSLSTPPPNDWTATAGTGTFINLTAFKDVDITSFDVWSGLDTGAMITMDFYWKPGPYQGFEENPGAWTLHESFSRTTNSFDDQDNFAFAAPLHIAMGDTIGMYIVGVVGGIQWRDITGSDTFSNADLEMFTDTGTDALFEGIDIFRNFAGTVNYGIAAPALPEAALVILAIVLLAGASLLLARRRRGIS